MRNKIIKILLFGSTHSSFICTMLIPFFHSLSLSHFQVSILIAIRKAIRIISDVPFGVIFDRFSGKFILFLSRIFKFISLIFYLIGNDFTFIAIGMIFDGLSYSSNHGKINVYMFNILRSKKNIKFTIKNKVFTISSIYVKVLAIYYAITDLFVAFLTFTSAFVLRYKNFNFLLKLSLIFSFCNIFTIFILPKFKNKKNKDEVQQKIEIYQDFKLQNYNQKIRNIKKIIFDVIFSIKFLYLKNKSIFYLIFFAGLFNFIAWQMNPIYTYILIEKKLSNFKIAEYGSISKILMAFGCVIPFILNNKRIKLKSSLFFISIFFIMIFLSSIFYSKYMIIFCSFFPSIFYAFFEGVIENFLDKNLKRSIRATVNSLSFVFSNTTSVIALLVFGYFSKDSNQKVYIIISGAILVMIFTLYYLIVKNLKNRT